MGTFIAVFIVFGLVMIGMAVGAIVSGRDLKGSCGGANYIDGNGECPVCGKNAGDICGSEDPNRPPKLNPMRL